MGEGKVALILHQVLEPSVVPVTTQVLIPHVGSEDMGDSSSMMDFPDWK